MRYNNPNEITSNLKSGLWFIFLGLIGFIILVFPVNNWWPFGEDAVPLMLQDRALITVIYELYPAIAVLALMFLVGLALITLKDLL